MTLLITSSSLWLAQTNTYVVAREEGGLAVVVDAPPDVEGIGEIVRRHNLTPVALVLTHGHVDHMGGAGEWQRSTGAKVYVHRDDDFLTLDPGSQLRNLFGMIPPGEYAPPETLESLTHGQKLQVADLSLDVRHTPGHTPGHCCFFLQEEGVLFSGDQLFAGSVGRTDLPGGSWEQLLESMANQVLTLEDQVRVLPGHGPETNIGRERRSNPFLTALTDS